MQPTVTLYTAQPQTISQQIRQGKTHYANMALIKEKYGTVAPVFAQAYHWFIQQAEHICPKPEQAESAIWAYYNLHHIEQHEHYDILILEVPLDQAIFFSMQDWNQVLNQRYIGISQQESAEFADKLEKQGIDYEGDIFRKPFYPLLKQEVMKSWLKMFRLHEPICAAISQGNSLPIPDMQAALWQLPHTWVKGVVG